MIRALARVALASSWLLIGNDVLLADTPVAILHSFGAGSDGVFPVAGVAVSGSTLFGTTEIGGHSVTASYTVLIPRTHNLPSCIVSGAFLTMVEAHARV